MDKERVARISMILADNMDDFTEEDITRLVEIMERFKGIQTTIMELCPEVGLITKEVKEILKRTNSDSLAMQKPDILAYHIIDENVKINFEKTIMKMLSLLYQDS